MSEILEGTFDYPKNNCTNCGYERDAVTALVAGEGPKPGDVGVCLKCAAFERFTESGYAPLSDEEFRALPEDIQREMMRVRAAISDLKLGRYFTAPGEA